MIFYLRFITTMGLSRTVSEINGDFSRKSQIFTTPVYLTPHGVSAWKWLGLLALEVNKKLS